MIGPDPDATRLLRHASRSAAQGGAGQNTCQYNNPEVDRLLQEGASTSTGEAQGDLPEDAGDRPRRTCPILPIFQYAHGRGHQGGAEGFKPNVNVQHEHLERRTSGTGRPEPASRGRPARPPAAPDPSTGATMRRFLLGRLGQSLVLLLHRLDHRLRRPAPGAGRAAVAVRAGARHDPGATSTGSRAQMGLDRPLPVQYCRLVLRGCCTRRLGPLLPRQPAGARRHRLAPVAPRCELMVTRHRSSPSLLGTWIGVMGAIRRYSLFDYARHRRRHGRALDPDLLVRARRHLRLLGRARLAAGRQHATRSATARSSTTCTT